MYRVGPALVDSGIFQGRHLHSAKPVPSVMGVRCHLPQTLCPTAQEDGGCGFAVSSLHHQHVILNATTVEAEAPYCQEHQGTR